MPDIWTKHPDIVKSLLEAGGFECGAEPRVLKPRDPNWTCIVDGEKISGDLYIHPLSEITEGVASMDLMSGASLLFLLLGLSLLSRKIIRKCGGEKSREKR